MGMNSSQLRIKFLLKRYTDGIATAVEEAELFSMIEIQRDEELIRNHIDELSAIPEPTKKMPETDWELLFQKINEEKNKQRILTGLNYYGLEIHIIFLRLKVVYLFKARISISNIKILSLIGLPSRRFNFDYSVDNRLVLPAFRHFNISLTLNFG